MCSSSYRQAEGKRNLNRGVHKPHCLWKEAALYETAVALSVVSQW